MKHILLISSLFTFIFATSMPTQLPEIYYEDSFEKILRFKMLNFDNEEQLVSSSQKELDTILQSIKKLEQEQKRLRVTVVGHIYSPDKYYPRKNHHNMMYIPEDEEAIEDNSVVYAQKIAQKLIDAGVDAQYIVTSAKGGYHMHYTDEDASSASLSNRVMVSVYILNPEDIDSDRDGVFDRYDRCVATPRGAKVDKNGCPLDSDKDGVVDYKDKCPGTPPLGVMVDAHGCPLDSDKDGVVDYKDKCENTPAGLTVDVHGCPLKESLKVYFKRGSAKIMRQSYLAIKKFAKFLKKNSGYRVKITGHTDSRGKATSNMQLSVKRAEAIKKALILEGIDASRIEIAGRGELDPIASNRTKEGRAKNRRIEIELLH
jgi:outer membrane protein OmpA-like peptidoglycan-associated protein